MSIDQVARVGLVSVRIDRLVFEFRGVWTGKHWGELGGELRDLLDETPWPGCDCFDRWAELLFGSGLASCDSRFAWSM